MDITLTLWLHRTRSDIATGDINALQGNAWYIAHSLHGLMQGVTCCSPQQHHFSHLFTELEMMFTAHAADEESKHGMPQSCTLSSPAFKFA